MPEDAKPTAAATDLEREPLQEVANRGRRTPTSRWHRVLLIMAGIVVIMLCWLGFRFWQLRHSYDVFLRSGRPSQHLFFSWDLILARRSTVRRWIEPELLATRDVSFGEVMRMMRLMRLLMHFAESDDSEMLLSRAAMGFEVVPCASSPVRDETTLTEWQNKLSDHLLECLDVIYAKRYGSYEQGMARMGQALDERGMAPEVREALRTSCVD